MSAKLETGKLYTYRNSGPPCYIAIIRAADRTRGDIGEYHGVLYDPQRGKIEWETVPMYDYDLEHMTPCTDKHVILEYMKWLTRQ